MRRWLHHSALALSLALAAIAPADLAAQRHRLATGTVLQQLGFTRGEVSPGLDMATTSLKITNSSASSLQGLRLWVVGMNIAGQPAQWDDVAERWSQSRDQWVMWVNSSGRELVSDTDLPLFPEFGLQPSSRLQYLTIGDLSAGDMRTFDLLRVMPQAVGSINSFVYVTTTVPEPSTVALTAAGVAALVVVARRRRVA
ncbi:MAG: PEP-CTERM sorting domain-containing protein [Burkholderiales bacterium]|jgi:hypothetical protein|nr:PEP-CTERM sorting domain-containing protein [Gemmatimonadaceae bacterium]MCU0870163.1 PEP-CTERM sorting domain-containing protein [Burkholderiales bacterium]